MKMTKYKVFALALAVCLVAILSMGTLAWFSAEDSVTNNFIIADSNDDGVADFSVAVTETKDGENWTDEGLEYTDILPGETLNKWAIVKNTSSSDKYSQYIRVTITVTGMPEWTAAVVGTDLKDSLAINEQVWDIDSVTYDAAAGTNTLVMYLNTTLAKDADVTVFETVTIPGTMVNEANNALNLIDFNIDVFAEAIQAENLGLTTPTAAAAFALID